MLRRGFLLCLLRVLSTLNLSQSSELHEVVSLPGASPHEWTPRLRPEDHSDLRAEQSISKPETHNHNRFLYTEARAIGHDQDDSGNSHKQYLIVDGGGSLSSQLSEQQPYIFNHDHHTQYPSMYHNPPGPPPGPHNDYEESQDSSDRHKERTHGDYHHQESFRPNVENYQFGIEYPNHHASEENEDQTRDRNMGHLMPSSSTRNTAGGSPSHANQYDTNEEEYKPHHDLEIVIERHPVHKIRHEPLQEQPHQVIEVIVEQKSQETIRDKDNPQTLPSSDHQQEEHHQAGQTRYYQQVPANLQEQDDAYQQTLYEQPELIPEPSGSSHQEDNLRHYEEHQQDSSVITVPQHLKQFNSDYPPKYTFRQPEHYPHQQQQHQGSLMNIDPTDQPHHVVKEERNPRPASNYQQPHVVEEHRNTVQTNKYQHHAEPSNNFQQPHVVEEHRNNVHTNNYQHHSEPSTNFQQAHVVEEQRNIVHTNNYQRPIEPSNNYEQRRPTEDQIITRPTVNLQQQHVVEDHRDRNPTNYQQYHHEEENRNMVPAKYQQEVVEEHRSFGPPANYQTQNIRHTPNFKNQHYAEEHQSSSPLTKYQPQQLAEESINSQQDHLVEEHRSIRPTTNYQQDHIFEEHRNTRPTTNYQQDHLVQEHRNTRPTTNFQQQIAEDSRNIEPENLQQHQHIEDHRSIRPTTNYKQHLEEEHRNSRPQSNYQQQHQVEEHRNIRPTINYQQHLEDHRNSRPSSNYQQQHQIEDHQSIKPTTNYSQQNPAEEHKTLLPTTNYQQHPIKEHLNAKPTFNYQQHHQLEKHQNIRPISNYQQHLSEEHRNIRPTTNYQQQNPVEEHRPVIPTNIYQKNPVEEHLKTKPTNNYQQQHPTENHRNVRPTSNYQNKKVEQTHRVLTTQAPRYAPVIDIPYENTHPQNAQPEQLPSPVKYVQASSLKNKPLPTQSYSHSNNRDRDVMIVKEQETQIVHPVSPPKSVQITSSSQRFKPKYPSHLSATVRSTTTQSPAFSIYHFRSSPTQKPKQEQQTVQASQLVKSQIAKHPQRTKETTTKQPYSLPKPQNGPKVYELTSVSRQKSRNRQEHVSNSEDQDDSSLPGSSGSIPGVAGQDYPILSVIPGKTTFRCAGKAAGFYADVDSRCQVYYQCNMAGHQQSFLCPNGTVFNQVSLVCEWWYNVDCKSSETHFEKNKALYKPQVTSSPISNRPRMSGSQSDQITSRASVTLPSVETNRPKARKNSRSVESGFIPSKYYRSYESQQDDMTVADSTGSVFVPISALQNRHHLIKSRTR